MKLEQFTITIRTKTARVYVSENVYDYNYNIVVPLTMHINLITISTHFSWKLCFMTVTLTVLDLNP